MREQINFLLSAQQELSKAKKMELPDSATAEILTAQKAIIRAIEFCEWSHLSKEGCFLPLQRANKAF